MDFNTVEIILLILVAFFSGFINSVAGGGGIITIPFLLMVGVSPLSTLATSKFQTSAGSAVAVFYFSKKKLINLKKIGILHYQHSYLEYWVLV